METLWLLFEVLVVFLAITVPYALFVETKRRKIVKVAFVGASETGKTRVVQALVLGSDKIRSTVPSLKPQTYNVNLGKARSVQVIDVPGHSRLQWQSAAALKGVNRVVVFVKDEKEVQEWRDEDGKRCLAFVCLNGRLKVSSLDAPLITGSLEQVTKDLKHVLKKYLKQT